MKHTDAFSVCLCMVKEESVLICNQKNVSYLITCDLFTPDTSIEGVNTKTFTGIQMLLLVNLFVF